MKKTVVLIAGFKRSGKDFSAEYMWNETPHSQIIRFADPMKVIISETFEIPLVDLETYKNDPELYGIEIKAYPNNQSNITIKHGDFRSILQKFGTEGMKPFFGVDVWATLTKKLVKESKANVIFIPDLRFIIEYTTMAQDPDINVITLRIDDDNITVWDDHASETEVLDFKYDYRINNTAKDHSLNIQLDKIVEKIYEKYVRG